MSKPATSAGMSRVVAQGHSGFSVYLRPVFVRSCFGCSNRRLAGSPNDICVSSVGKRKSACEFNC